MLEDHRHIWITQQKEASQITRHARISVVAQRCALHVSLGKRVKDFTLGFSAAGAAPSAAAGLGALGFLACHIALSTSQQIIKAVCVLITPLLIQRCSNLCTAGISLRYLASACNTAGMLYLFAHSGTGMQKVAPPWASSPSLASLPWVSSASEYRATHVVMVKSQLCFSKQNLASLYD